MMRFFFPIVKPILKKFQFYWGKEHWGPLRAEHKSGFHVLLAPTSLHSILGSVSLGIDINADIMSHSSPNVKYSLFPV